MKTMAHKLALYKKMELFSINILKIIAISSILSCNLLNAQKVDSYYDTGYYYYYYDNYEEAINYFDKVLDIDSNHYNANLYKGASLFVLEKYNEGIFYFNKPFILDSAHNYSFIYGMLGSAFYYTQEYLLSIEYITKSININATGYRFFVRGRSYNRINEYEKALLDFNSAIENGEIEPNVYFERAISNYYLNNFEQSVSDFLKCRELDGDHELIDYFLGDIFFNYQYFQKAIEYFKVYMKNGTDEIKKSHSIFKIGVGYYFIGEYENALLVLNELQLLEPEYLGGFIFKGMSYLKLSKYEEARKNLEKALSIDSENSLTLHQMGVLEFSTQNNEKGYFYFDESTKYAVKQNDDMVLFGLAESYGSLGDTAKAIEYLNLLISINPIHYKAILARIELNSHFLTNSEKSVLDDFDLLINIFKDSEPISAFFIAQKAIVLFDNEKFKEGLVEIDKAISLHPFSEYIAIKAFIKTFYEYIISKKVGKSQIPSDIQEQILEDIDKVLQSNHRKMDTYLLKTTVLITFKRFKEACETSNEAVKLGAIINKEQLKFICNKNKGKEKNIEWEFFYNLTSFEERFSI